MNVDWRNTPCLFECLYDLSRNEDELLTIEESIEHNFWRSGIEPLKKETKNNE